MRRLLSISLVLVVSLIASPASSEQAGGGSPRFVHGLLDAGHDHTCAILGSWQVRCWGNGADGRLGYGNENDIGDDEVPASVGPIDIGAGRTARAVAAGGFHTCVILDDGAVRCWGYNDNGHLGYGHKTFIGDDEAPGGSGPVDLGSGRTAKAIAAGSDSVCAVRDDGGVLCWGYGQAGRLGYGNENDIGDNETPASAGLVSVGAGRTVQAITAGDNHTCAILDDGAVRCWGDGTSGSLGYGNVAAIGDDELPASAGPVDLGPGRTARAIAAGIDHTCAILDDGSVRCWGRGGNGRLGYGGVANVGDDETPAAMGPVDLGPGRTARAIAAGEDHTCAILDDRSVRCWGKGAGGRLGYANQNDIGDSETPGSVGPVDLGPGRTAKAITAGEVHTCALLDDGTVRCWGVGAGGVLGYGTVETIGDDETPGAAGPVSLGAPVFVGDGVTSLSLRSKPRKDLRAPFRFRLFGALELPEGPPLGEACDGTVKLRVRRGKKVIRRAADDLAVQDGACVFRERIRLAPGKVGDATRLKAIATFTGNELLAADASRARKLRVG